MEGISDGMAVDHCYYCALLFPQLEPCPKCQNRFRYRPATLRNAAEVEREIASAITSFRDAPSVTSATGLLKLWHEFGEQALPMLARATIRIEELREHFERAGDEEPNSL